MKNSMEQRGPNRVKRDFSSGVPLPRPDRYSQKIYLARLACPPSDRVVFWRWLAEQLFPDWRRYSRWKFSLVATVGEVVS